MSEFKDKFVYESCDVEGADVFNLSCEILEAADKKLQTQAEIIEVLMGAIIDIAQVSHDHKHGKYYYEAACIAKQKAEKLINEMGGR